MRRRLVGVARAIALACALARPAAGQGARATVSGTVYDSVGQRRLEGAFVQLVRADSPAVNRTARSDASGAFEFDSVPAGSWLLGFYHPVLDSLDLTTPLLLLTVREPSPVRAMLAVASPQTIVRDRCAAAGDTSGLWYGRTRSALTGLPVGGAAVVARWTTIVAGEGDFAADAGPCRGVGE